MHHVPCCSNRMVYSHKCVTVLTLKYLTFLNKNSVTAVVDFVCFFYIKTVVFVLNPSFFRVNLKCIYIYI